MASARLQGTLCEKVNTVPLITAQNPDALEVNTS